MTQYFSIHQENPQGRLLGQAAAIIRHGGLIAYPTDSCYALGCLATNKTAVDRIIKLRRLNAHHHMTLVCHDLADVGALAKIDNTAFRLVKSLTPGPFTFLLKATRDVPRRLQHPQRKTIGLRIPDNRVALGLLETLGEPILSSSLILPGEEFPRTDPREIEVEIGHQVDLVIDAGAGGLDKTTVIDLIADPPVIIRQGKGIISGLSQPA